MERQGYVERLERKKIRPTAVRILVLEALSLSPHALSLPDLERELETVDKSSIFRTLNLFHEYRLVHTIEDGSGILKYEVCHEEQCSVSDMHPHFFCVVCRKTYCFEQERIPEITLPKEFVQYEINYMIKGVCPACAGKIR